MTPSDEEDMLHMAKLCSTLFMAYRSMVKKKKKSHGTQFAELEYRTTFIATVL